MSEQKILPKGKVPATEEDIRALEDKIYSSLMIAPDRVLDGVIASNEAIISRMGEYEAEVRDKTKYVINNRNIIRTMFYRTFGSEITKEEITLGKKLSAHGGSRMNLMIFLIDRVREINKIGPCVYYRNEVDRILQDYNDAVQLTITKYKEYQKKYGEEENLKLYEESEIKEQLDTFTNCMYDTIRVFNRTIEDDQMNIAEIKLQMNANKQSKE